MSDLVETDETISAELLKWADSIDAEGDDLRPLLRRAAEALADRKAQVKSVVDGAAKFADEITRLRAEVERLTQENARLTGGALYASGEVRASEADGSPFRTGIEQKL